MLTDMLVTMSDRGPDSAGIAIYRDHGAKITLQSVTPDADFNGLGDLLSGRCSLSLQMRDTHAVLHLPTNKLLAARNAISEMRPSVRIMSTGKNMEIYKEVGLPRTSPSALISRR